MRRCGWFWPSIGFFSDIKRQGDLGDCPTPSRGIVRTVASYPDSSKLFEVLWVAGASGLGPSELAEALWMAGSPRSLPCVNVRAQDRLGGWPAPGERIW